MAYQLTTSTSPVIFDTLPALKVRFWHLPAFEPKLYAMARGYLLGEDLQLCLTSFEREPPPESRLCFAAAGGGDRLLLIRLSPKDASLHVCNRHSPPTLWQELPGALLFAAPPQRLAGVDEQGWFWGAQLSVAAEALAEAGIPTAVGGCFGGAVFQYAAMPGAYGASHPVDGSCVPLNADCFDAFEVVGY